MSLDDLSVNFNITPKQTIDGNKESDGSQNTFINSAFDEGAANSTTSTTSTVQSAPVGGTAPQVENSSDVGYETTATQNGTEKKHSESEIQQRLKPIFDKYGVTYSIEIIKSVHHNNNIDWLLNTNNAKFKKCMDNLAKCLEKAFSKHYNKQTKTVDLDKAIETTKDYKRAIIFGGWDDLDAYEKAKAEYTYTDKNGNKHAMTLSGAIKFELRLEKDLDKYEESERVQLVTQYFDNKFKGFLEKTHDKIKAAHLLRQHISVLMSNSSDAEKSYLGKIVKKYVKESEQLQEYFQSIKDPSIRAKVADGYDVGELMELNKDSIVVIVSNMSKEAVEKMSAESRAELDKLLQEHKEELANAIKKIKSGNNEPLTDIEKSALDKFEKLTGIRVGVNSNTNIDDATKSQENNAWENLLRQNEDIYRYHLEEIRKFVEEHSDILNMSVEKFESLINKYTNGNYSTVVSDIDPVSSESSSAAETSAYNSETGSFSTLPEEVYQTAQKNLAELNKKIYDNNKEDDELGKSVKNTLALTIANPTKITSQKGLKYFFSNTSNAFGKIISGKVEVIGTNAEKAVVDIYDRMDNALKGTCLAFASNEWFGKFLNITDASVIAAYMDKGGLGSSFDRTKQMKEIVEEEKV